MGLTNLGLIHTAIAIVAVIAGLRALWRDGRIDPLGGPGKVYLWATVLTCLTGLGIFQHGGFGAPHMLSIITLVTLAVATPAATRPVYGRWSPYVVTVGYSLTLFFHAIPGVTETFTRVPVGAPLFSGPEDPALQKVVGVFFAIFLVGAAFQVRRLRSRARGAGIAPVA